MISLTGRFKYCSRQAVLRATKTNGFIVCKVLDLLMDDPLQFLLMVIFEAFHILSRN